MERDIRVRPAERSDREYVERLLEANGLPVADVSEKLDCLYVCERDGEAIGAGGIERYGEVGLLRSVVVAEPVRGEGYGKRLCAELLERARADGIEELYLLTETAPEFFASMGFERLDRDSAPEPIQKTREFRELCPSTATCMRRDLRGEAALR